MGLIATYSRVRIPVNVNMVVANPIRIVSSDHLYGIQEVSALFYGIIDDWEVIEEYDAEDAEHDLEGIRRYRVVLQSQPTTTGEAAHAYPVGVELAETLERLWLYVGDGPLSGRRFGKTLAPLTPPERWTTNYEDRYRELSAKEFGLSFDRISIARRDWAYLPALPLSTAVRAVENFRDTDESIRTLIELHYNAHTAYGLHAEELAFARALELGRELLPGHSNHEKQEALSPEVQDSLSRPLSWLSRLSNNRFNTRHIVNQHQKPAILPAMTQEEHDAFTQNADVVLRGIVSSQLGIPFVALRSGTPPETA